MKWLLAMMLIATNISLFGQNLHTEAYEFKEYISNNETLNYRLLLPINFDESKEYPVVLFLHGMGERGTDNKAQLTHGSKLFKDSIEQYPAIVIFPQCPPTDYWANLYRPDKGGKSRRFEFHVDEGPNPSLALVIELVEDMLDKNYVDEDRFYVSGLSMGAMGVWELLWRIPDKITAAIPICGGGPLSKVEEMINTPIWAVHGVKDDVVHPRYSIRMVKQIQQKGGKAKISLFPNANHNSWDQAFADPDFMNFMFKKSHKSN